MIVIALWYSWCYWAVWTKDSFRWDLLLSLPSPGLHLRCSSHCKASASKLVPLNPQCLWSILKLVCFAWALEVVGRHGEGRTSDYPKGARWHWVLSWCPWTSWKAFQNEGGNHMLACSFHEGEHYNNKSWCSQRLGKILEVFVLKCWQLNVIIKD